MNKDKRPTPMPTEAVHPLEPMLTWPWHWWVDAAIVLVLVVLPLIVLGLVLIL